MATRSYALAAGTLAVGTSGYIVGGVLPDISRGLGITPSAAGQLATVFAVAYAVNAPLLTVATGRLDRRRLLVAGLLTAGLGDALAAVVPSYPVLVAARALSAIGACVYTPTATYVATTLSPPEQRGRSVATVYIGLTSSLVLGVPAASAIGAVLGYQSAFAMLAVMELLAAVAVGTAVPRMGPPPIVGLRARLASAVDRRTLSVLSITALGYLAVVSAYTYIAPLLAVTAGLTGPTISLVLLGYGVGAMVGNVLGGPSTDRYGSHTSLVVAFVGLTLVLATLPWTTTSGAASGAVLFVWGVFAWSVNPALYSWLAGLSPANAGLLLSLNASAIYVGAALGGAFGGLIISWHGVRLVPPLAAIAGVVALALLASRRTRATSSPTARDEHRR